MSDDDARVAPDDRPAGPPSAGPGAIAVRAAVLRRLELDVTRRLDGLLSGDYIAAVVGTGSEAAGARAYSPGDDARHIDWNLSARALAPHIRTTDADRELHTTVVVDRSASMDFGTASREKREVALSAVAAFGFLTVRSGNHLGVLMSGSDALVWIPARTGRPGLLAALAAVYDTPRLDAPPAPDATLAAALARAARTQHRHGQVIVVSDFLDAADWAAPLRRLCLRHQVIAVHVVDPREFELPDVGMLAVVDSETGRHLHVQTRSAALRERYRAAASQRHQAIRQNVIRAGAEYLELSTDRDWVGDVARFVNHRHRVRPRTWLAGVGGPRSRG
jgi:uncharacterized protein (DUF58 family)